MTEGSGNDYQIAGSVVTFEYNFLDVRGNKSKVNVYYVKSLV